MTNLSYTENNAIQHKTSGNECLNFFSRVGAMRTTPEDNIISNFIKSYTENPELAIRILFWSRASRIGAGERRVFHTILKKLHSEAPKFVADNFLLLAELGYWKDLLPYFDNYDIVRGFGDAILQKDRLACKWAPRKGLNARKLRDVLGFTNKEYRKWLKLYSSTVEQQMSNKDWNSIQYSTVPGEAMRKYGKSFNKQDRERFEEWKKDNTKASVSASYPHNIVKTVMTEWNGFIDNADWDLAEKQWANLPDYIKEGENILPMIDVSGSMQGLPMLVSISLGLYLSERNKESFNGTFLTFSGSPELIRLDEGTPLKDRLHRIINADWGMNTDFQKAYRTILDTAVSFNVPQSAMPTMLLVLSDMQFDQSQRRYWDEYEDDLNYTEKLHFESIKEEFNEAGYKAPKLVFWNLRNSRCEGSPAQANDNGVAMVSGFNPVLMKAILAVKDFNPLEIMYESVKDIEVNTNNLPEQLSLESGREDILYTNFTHA